jgi:glucan biosynthesis protein
VARQWLLDSYLEQDIERETYLKKKAELMLEKKTLEEKITTLEQRQTAWVEPLRKWIKEADSLQKIAGADDPFAKKVISKKIFGSNLFLTGKTVIEGEKKLANLGHLKFCCICFDQKKNFYDIVNYNAKSYFKQRLYATKILFIRPQIH